MNDKVKIAITGGIGSGKSTALSIINKLGYKTVSFDKIYNDLLENKEFVLELSEMFDISPLICENCCKLNKVALSKKVFSDKEQLKILNDFTHKKIFEKAFSKYDDKIVFYEVPLLFEGNYQSFFDHVFVVVRNLEERIQSAVKRDNVPREYIINKLNNQIDYDNYDLSLHTIIKNDGDISALKNNIVKAIGEIIC